MESGHEEWGVAAVRHRKRRRPYHRRPKKSFLPYLLASARGIVGPKKVKKTGEVWYFSLAARVARPVGRTKPQGSGQEQAEEGLRWGEDREGRDEVPDVDEDSEEREQAKEGLGTGEDRDEVPDVDEDLVLGDEGVLITIASGRRQ